MNLITQSLSALALLFAWSIQLSATTTLHVPSYDQRVKRKD